MNLYDLHPSMMGRTSINIIVPKLAYMYINTTVDPEYKAKLERAIARDPETAYRYSYDKGGSFSHRRWPPGEAAIASVPYYAYHYARNTIKGRWPEGEAAIAKDLLFSCEYAQHVLGSRFPEGEALIAKNPGYAYRYARDIIQGRWPEGEPAIRNSGIWSQYQRMINQ